MKDTDYSDFCKENDMDKLKLIKAVVALLTFLIVFGILMAATLIYKKINPSTPTDNLAELSLNEPSGSRIHTLFESEGNLYFLIKDGGEPDRLLVLDAKTLHPKARVMLSSF